jgi:hypothetical protein
MVIAAVAAVLLAVLAAFQLALALGAPLGDIAWGGKYPGVLPMRLRVASAVAGLAIYPAIAAVVLTAGGILGADWLPFDITVVLWLLVVFFAIGAIVNALSPSPRERIWSPVSAVLAICCALLALGPAA